MQEPGASISGTVMAKPFILVVEDNFLIAEAAAHVLSGAGYRAAITDSARAALVQARLDRPDVAIVDLALKDGMTGAQGAQELRALGCAVILCTGFAGSLARDSIEAAGAARVLTKPVDPGDLLDAVKGALIDRQ